MKGLNSISFILLTISLIWGASILLINPLGEFPLNDDGIFSYPVKTLLEDGVLKFNRNSGPTLFLQILWGYLFCYINGSFSFSILRISTLTLAYISLIGYFFLCKNYTKRIFTALFLLLIVLFNPLFFSLSFTFMTDIPFLTLVLLSLLAYQRYYQLSKIQFRIIGFVIACLSFLIRQPGLILLFSMELMLIFLKDEKPWKIVRLLLLMVFCTALYSFTETLKVQLNISQNFIPVTGKYLDQLVRMPSRFLFNFAKRSLMSVFYLGFFMLPLFPQFLNHFFARPKTNIFLLLGLVAFNLTIIPVLAYYNYIFPYGGGVIYNFHLGPLLLRDVYPFDPLGVNDRQHIGISFVSAFGFFCQINGCLILIYLCKRALHFFKQPKIYAFELAILLFNAAYLPSMMITTYFDRYLIVPFASLLLIVGKYLTFPKKQFKYSFFILLAFGLFSILGTSDYLNRSRAIKFAWNYLISKEIPVIQIAGGIALDSFYRPYGMPEADEYIIATNSLPDYKTIKSFSYFNTLFLRHDHIYILKNNSRD